MKQIFLFLCWTSLFIGLCYSQTSQQPTTPAPSAAQPVPVLDGGAGPCSAEFTVTLPDGKPAAEATVKVHIAYGFGGFHKLDLQQGANADGRVRFTGMPARVRRSQLEFEASKGQLVGRAMVDPAAECQARREIKLGDKVDSGK